MHKPDRPMRPPRSRSSEGGWPMPALAAACALALALPAPWVRAEAEAAAPPAASASVAQDEPAPVASVAIVSQRDPQFIPYADFIQAWRKFERVADAQQLELVVRVRPVDPAMDLSSLRVVLVGNDGYKREVPVGAGGKLQIPVDDEALRQQADFRFNVRRGSLAPELSVLLRLSGQQWRYDELMRRMAQADEAERSLMGFAQRLFLPRSDALAFLFPKGSHARLRVQAAQGETVIEASARGTVVLPRRDDWLAENPLVLLSEPPLAVLAGIAPRTPTMH